MSTSTTCKYTLTDSNGTSNEGTITVEVNETPVTAQATFDNPWNKTSAYRRPIGTGATYASPSASWSGPSSSYAAKAAHGTWMLRNYTSKLFVSWSSPFTTPTSIMNAGNPLVSVTHHGKQTGLNLPTPPLRITPNFPPDWNISYYDQNRDAIAMFFDEETNTIHEFFYYKPDTKQAGIYRAVNISGRGHGTNRGDRIGMSATGFSTFTGCIKSQEIRETGRPLLHSHCIALPATAAQSAAIGSPYPLLSPFFMLPATTMDGSMMLTQNGLGPLAYGSLLAIPTQAADGPNLDALTYKSGERGRRMAQSMRDYGIYVNDGSGSMTIRADGLLGGGENDFRDDIRMLFGHIAVVTNSTTGWTGSCVRPSSVLTLTGVPGTFNGTDCVGGGTPLAPNTAFDA